MSGYVGLPNKRYGNKKPYRKTKVRAAAKRARAARKQNRG